MEEQNYLADEKSYVDDFLYGLKWDLAVRVWSYESKPQKLSDAFYRARFEESMIGIKAYLDKWNTSPNTVTSEPISLVADALQASNDSDSGSETTAKKPDAEVLEVNELSDSEEMPHSEENMGSESAIKHSSIEDDIKLDEMLLPILVGKHEGIERNKGNVQNVDEEGVVLPLIDLQSVLGSLGDTNVKGSSKGSTKAWFEELTLGLKVVLSQNAIDHVARKVFNEMFQSIRAVLVDEQVIDPYTNGFNFNSITLFDPGGGRKYALSLSGGVVRPLIGKTQGTCVNGMKGVVSSLRHAHSTIASGDKHCLIAFNHFHIFNSGSHAIFALIDDSIAHGDNFTEMDLKALFEEVNSKLLMKMLSFDPGGCSLSQIGCDPFESDGKHEDNCLEINVDVALVQAKEYCAKSFGEKLEMNGLSLRPVSSFVACKNIENDSFCVVVLLSNRGSWVTYIIKRGYSYFFKMIHDKIEYGDVAFVVARSFQLVNNTMDSKTMSVDVQHVQSIILELGEKSLIVKFEAVGNDKTVGWSMCGCFWTIKQICITTSCLLIHVSIATEFLDKIVKWCQDVKVSDPLEVGCRLGLVARKGQYDTLFVFLSTAVKVVAQKIEQCEEFNGGKMIHHHIHLLQQSSSSVGLMMQPSSSMIWSNLHMVLWCVPTAK